MTKEDIGTQEADPKADPKADPEAYTILPVGEDEDCLEEAGWDLWGATEAAEQVFRDEGVRISSEESVTLAVICEGQIVGAASFGHHNEEDGVVYTFSVAVAAAHQQRGLGRKLVERLLADTLTVDHGQYRIWVINPNMARLLGRMGFETEGPEWTRESPHMYRHF